MLFVFLISVAYVFPAHSSTKIIMFGDSLVAGYGLSPSETLPAQLENALIKSGLDVKVINAGISGDTTFGGLERVDSIIQQSPNIVVIVLGANDMLRGSDPEKTYENLDSILQKLKNKNIKTMLTTITSSLNYGLAYKSNFDSIYPKLAKKHSIPLLPFFMEKIIYDQTKILSDGIHPNAVGVASIVEEIMPIIKKEIQ